MHVRFGAAGDDTAILREGWAGAEQAHRWAMGEAPAIELPAAKRPTMLELDLAPFLSPIVTRQRLCVAVDGAPSGMVLLREPAVLHVPLPASDAPLRIVLGQPDAGWHGEGSARRQLGFAYRSLRRLPAPPRCGEAARDRLPGEDLAALTAAAQACTGLALPALAGQFESLGHACEFGLVQREFGCEVPSLLRFSGIGMHASVRGVQNGFAGIGAPDNIFLSRPAVPGRQDFRVHDRRYGTESHSFEHDAAQAARTRRLAERRMDFLARLFLERARMASRIFVFCTPVVTDPAPARAVLHALRQHGRAPLLWVSLGPDRPAGSVAQRADGLLHGTIDRFAPVDNGFAAHHEVWISLLANAYRLACAQGYRPAPEGDAKEMAR